MMLPAFFCSMVPPFLKSVLVSANGAADAVPAVASSSAALIPMMFRMVRSFARIRCFGRLRRKPSNSAADVNAPASGQPEVGSPCILARRWPKRRARRPRAGRAGAGAVAREGARADPGGRGAGRRSPDREGGRPGRRGRRAAAALGADAVRVARRAQAGARARHVRASTCAALVALDVGASTGGFTDCLLQRGAARVYCVDVGHGQLDWKIASDPRVRVLDRVNIRLGAARPAARARRRRRHRRVVHLAAAGAAGAAAARAAGRAGGRAGQAAVRGRARRRRQGRHRARRRGPGARAGRGARRRRRARLRRSAPTRSRRSPAARATSSSCSRCARPRCAHGNLIFAGARARATIAEHAVGGVGRIRVGERRSASTAA